MVHRSATTSAFQIAISLPHQPAGLTPGKQVETPRLLRRLPVGGFVDHLSPTTGLLTILQQPQFHLVDAAGQRAGIKRLQTGYDRLGLDQVAVPINLHHARPGRCHLDRCKAWYPRSRRSRSELPHITPSTVGVAPL